MFRGGRDNDLRAFDAGSGEALWCRRLPAGLQAAPMIHRARNGKQLAVIAGQCRMSTTLGAAAVAFALP